MQIVLWILKIIGGILLAVLGLFVLAVCFVLFTPRYKGEAGCQGKKETLSAQLQFSLCSVLQRGAWNTQMGRRHGG